MNQEIKKYRKRVSDDRVEHAAKSVMDAWYYWHQTKGGGYSKHDWEQMRAEFDIYWNQCKASGRDHYGSERYDSWLHAWKACQMANDKALADKDALNKMLLSELTDAVVLYEQDIEQKDTEIARLREALTRIKHQHEQYAPSERRMYEIAIKALEQTDENDIQVPHSD